VSHDTQKLSGGLGGGETPVPIPNTEVKPSIVDGTAWETEWESRTLPGVNLKAPIDDPTGAFKFIGRNPCGFDTIDNANKAMRK
jgi:hypothetical protein